MELSISNPKFANTSEAYSGSLIIGNNHMIIPYANLNLTADNPLTECEAFIDFCYLIFTSVFSLDYMVESVSIEVISNRSAEISETQFVAANGRNNGNGAELKISYLEWKLLPLADSIISKEKFKSPRAISNLRQLTDWQKNFLNGNSLPIEIKNLVGDNFYKVLI